jgi:hypothetical protein
LDGGGWSTVFDFCTFRSPRIGNTESRRTRRTTGHQGLGAGGWGLDGAVSQPFLISPGSGVRVLGLGRFVVSGRCSRLKLFPDLAERSRRAGRLWRRFSRGFLRIGEFFQRIPLGFPRVFRGWWRGRGHARGRFSRGLWGFLGIVFADWGRDGRRNVHDGADD